MCRSLRSQRGFAFMALAFVIMSAFIVVTAQMQADMSRQQRYTTDTLTLREQAKETAELFYKDNPDWNTLDLSALETRISVITGIGVKAELMLAETSIADGVVWRDIAINFSEEDDFSGDILIVDGEGVQRATLDTLRNRMKQIALLFEHYHLQRAALIEETGNPNPFETTAQMSTYIDKAIVVCTVNHYFEDSLSQCKSSTHRNINYLDYAIDCDDSVLSPVPCGEGLFSVSRAAEIVPENLWTSPYGGDIFYHVRPSDNFRTLRYKSTNEELGISHTSLTDAGAVIVADLPWQTVEWIVAGKARRI